MSMLLELIWSINLKSYRQMFRQVSAALVLLLFCHEAGAHSFRCETLFETRPTDSFSYQPQENPLENLENFGQTYGIQMDYKFRADSLRKSFIDLIIDPHLPFIPGGMTAPIETSAGINEAVIFAPKQKEQNIGRADSNSLPEVTAQTVLTNNVVHSPELIGEIWKSSIGERFRFMNAGSRLLMQDGTSDDVLNSALAVARKYLNLNVRIKVPLNPLWAKAKQVILDRQHLATGKVTDHYAKNKPYLHEEDLVGLRFSDFFNSNLNDYFMLLNDSNKSPLELSSEEFYQNLAVVLRLARIQFRPESDNMWFAGVGFQNSMPHNSRLSRNLKEKFEKFFNQLAYQAPLRIAEISRFNRMSPVSREVMNAFMLKMFTQVAESSDPVDLFILECDEGLLDYYSKYYNFKVLTRTSEHQISEGEKPEYLMYLDTRTPEYQKMIARLTNASNGVRKAADRSPPPVRKWTSGWNLTSEYFQHSYIHKRWKAYEAYEKSLKNIEQMHLSREEKFLLFTNFWKDMVPQFSGMIGIKEKVLILGEFNYFLSQFLLQQYNSRMISTAEKDLENNDGKFNEIILIGELNRKSSSEQKLLLEKVFRSLNHGGSITIVERFNHDHFQSPDFKAPSDEVQFSTIAENAIKNQVLMNRNEIHQALGKLKQLFYQQISNEEFMAIAHEVGFDTQMYSSAGKSIKEVAAIILTKP